MNPLREYARDYLETCRNEGQAVADAAHVASTPPGAACGTADHESTDGGIPRASSDDRPLPFGRGRLVGAAPPST